MKKYLIILSFITFAFISCKKNNVSTADGFTVETIKTTYKVGDTVNFKLSGNPDIITFYSGEAGSKYEYSNRTALAGKVTMSFNTLMQQGSTDPKVQQGTLHILASSNFLLLTPGVVLDSAAVANAPVGTWTDITNRFTLPKVPVTTSTYLPSGSADITDLASVDKPVIFAFRYTDTARATLAQRFYQINTFTIDNTLPDGSKVNEYLLVNGSATPLLTPVNIKNLAVKWGINSSSPAFNINLNSPVNQADNEDWIFTKPVNLFAVSPDLGLGIKGYTDNTPDTYQKVYKAAGTCTVTFIGKNQNIYDSKQVVRHITLTITP